jgi:hypothetical protein
MKIPFSAYDFFGYLAAGFLLVCGIEFAFDQHLLLNASAPLSVPRFVFWVFVAYVAGHLIATLSSFVLEHGLVRRVLKAPEENLFATTQRRWRWLFPIYFQAFPALTQTRVLDKSTAKGFPAAGRALFHHCHAVVKGEKTTAERLSTFLNIYGFCRNISLTCLLVALVLTAGIAFDLTRGGFAWDHWQPRDTHKAVWAAVALFTAVGMLYRYLKFFKHYTIEVFTTYAEMK